MFFACCNDAQGCKAKNPALRRALFDLKQEWEGSVRTDLYDATFRALGFIPDAECVFEKPELAVFMGRVTIFETMPTDVLHQVRDKANV